MRDHRLAALDIEELDILVEQFVQRLALDIGTDREHIQSELVNVEPCDPRQELRRRDILGRRRGRLEFQRIRQDRAKDQSREVLGKRDLILPEDRCDNGR